MEEDLWLTLQLPLTVHVIDFAAVSLLLHLL